MDIVVMNFALDHEPYLDDRYDVQVVDHSLATNAGGIIFRNTPFARRFVANWAAMAREYPWPFADNGALLEALASTWPTYTRRGRPCAKRQPAALVVGRKPSPLCPFLISSRQANADKIFPK